jgi:sulfur carrier protein
VAPRSAHRWLLPCTGFFFPSHANFGAAVNITINGEAATIDPLSVQAYLEQLGIDPRRVAVELNREILPKGAYLGTTLKDGDSIEIVHFVGGG